MVEHLYVHVPFCHRICPYCAFYKHRPEGNRYPAFVDAVISELRAATERWAVKPRTIYFGGGTPSMLPGPQWERLAEAFAEYTDLSELREWTIEANPRTFNAAKARIWSRIGIHRVSLGAQSLDAGVLRTLGRDHTPDDVLQAFADLRNAGIENLNIDLMFSIPGQSLASWEVTLDVALEAEPKHLSTYNLTYEEDTPFFERFQSGQWVANPDQDAPFYEVTHERLRSAGFSHYEVSNFARPGWESLHNRAYWEGRDYLGLGPSAVSTVAGRRWKNLSDTREFVARMAVGQSVVHEEETLGAEEVRLERLSLQLRTREGIPRAWTGGQALGPLLSEGLVEQRGERVRLTLSGMMLADEIAGYFV